MLDHQVRLPLFCASLLRYPAQTMPCLIPRRTYAALKGLAMSRLNLEPVMTFSDGSYLAISTECSREGEFTCSVYSVAETDDHLAFRSISRHALFSSSCFTAQEQAYHYAVRLYPDAAQSMKKPPYLIWHGPRSSELL